MVMLARFFQLFMLAALVLLLPSLFYLSRQQQAYDVAKDYALMQTQKTQGQGPPPAIDPELAQSWKWTKPWEGWDFKAPGVEALREKLPFGKSTAGDVSSKAIMPKMDNATAK